MDATQIRDLIAGYIGASNEAKQKLGRCFAKELGLNPGPLGRDDGIDGLGFNEENSKIYFQCKLRAKPLGQSDADDFYQKIRDEKADIGIMLAGVGYKRTFEQRRSEYPEISNVIIYLLTLEDILSTSSKYEEACRVLPKLTDLHTTSIKSI